MATAIIMPKLGMAMSEGTVVKWLKQDEETVEKGEIVVVVMSKKITYEVEAPAYGVLRIVADANEKRPVGEVVGLILEPGEPMPELAEVTRPEPEAVETEEKAPVATPVPAAVPAAASSPAARRRARELGVEIDRVQGSGPGGRITEKDVDDYHEALPLIDATPLAQRIAEDEGIDLATIKGSGPGGRIVEEDVLRALEGAPAAGLPPAIPFEGMRQAIAEGMMLSLQTMAQLTMTARADVTELRAMRPALAERLGNKISFTDLLVKAAAVALREHPLLGARLEGKEIILPAEIHIGVAVALEDGLIVPVLRNVDRLSLVEIHNRLGDLAKRARENALQVDEVAGACFTITNLGIFGIDVFTPIINPPEVAILGVGGMAEELALQDGRVVPRHKMTLSLTIDHRLVDGAPGAAFLRTMVQLLAHPALIFAGPPPAGREEA